MKHISKIFIIAIMMMTLVFFSTGFLFASGLEQDGHVHSTSGLPPSPPYIDHPEIPFFIDNYLTRYMIFETDREFMLTDHFGGTWTDAEKTADNADDDLMCWALAAANTLEWTGWGFYDGSGYTNTDEIYREYGSHFTDEGSLTSYAWEWWFSGAWYADVPDDGWSSIDVAGGGDHWDPPYIDADYTLHNENFAVALSSIDDYLRNGWAVQLSIYDGGHSITCWGFTYDIAFDKASDPDGYYTGIWVTDSDDDKGNNGPEETVRNRLRYYTVEYDEINGYWYMPNYGSGWHIKGVNALKPFPDETRPVADAGGPYECNEGQSITLTASATDDDTSLQYRWDFNNDHIWDTAWSTSATISHAFNDNYEGDVVVLVSDGRMQDEDHATLKVKNVAPTLTDATLSWSSVSENGIISVSGNILDPGHPDQYTVKINWNDGSPVELSISEDYPSFSAWHQYMDDNPTGTGSDAFQVTISVKDEDMTDFAGTVNKPLTVNNLAPTVSFTEPDIPFFVLPLTMETNFSGSYDDTGTLDTHTALWDWKDTSTLSVGIIDSAAKTVTGSHVFLEAGDFVIQLMVTDDDTGIGSDTMTLHVCSADEATGILNEYIQQLPGTAFKEKADQRKKAIDAIVKTIPKLLEKEEYQEVIDILEDSIRSKADDYLTDQKNDWIIEPIAQQNICEMVDLIVAYLEYLLTT